MVPSLFSYNNYKLLQNINKNLDISLDKTTTLVRMNIILLLGILLLVGEIIVTVVLLATLLYELVGPLLTKMALIKAGEIIN